MFKIDRAAPHTGGEFTRIHYTEQDSVANHVALGSDWATTKPKNIKKKKSKLLDNIQEVVIANHQD